MTAGRSFWGAVSFLAGLVFIFVGERLVGSGTTRGVLTALGVALVLAAITWQALRFVRARGDARKAEGILLAVLGLGLLALVLYGVQSDLLPTPLGQTSPRLATVLAVLWPALLITALLPLLMVELAYASMARAPLIELGRVRGALYSGLGLAAALIFAFAVVYVATERDVKWDLSYFRTARPGTSTRNLVASLDEPIDVYLFFPPANDVREEVHGYLSDLARESNQLRLHELDQAVDPVRAKELGVSANGAVVFAREGRKETLQLGVRLESVRTQLRNLDRDVQKRLLLVARSKRTIYLTTGHGERSEVRSAEDRRALLATLRDLLRSQNYDVRNLGAAEGLAADVPSDASAVFIIGPTSPFSAEELASLKRYLDRGGRLLAALDPEAKVTLAELLAPWGVQVGTEVLANDVVFYRRTHRPSDRGILVTASFSSHPSVSTLARVGSQGAMAFALAGAVEEAKDRPPTVNLDFTVHAHGATWKDVDGNFEFDPKTEVRRPYEFAVAVSPRASPDQKPETLARLIVVGDSDAFADGVIENPGNTLFALDGARWLLGDESIAGEIQTESDVPVQHTRSEDVAWFYSTIFVVPGLVLVAGFFANRRRKVRIRAGEGR